MAKMFDIFRKMFGRRKKWEKASKCKKLIEQVWRELNIKKKRIDSIIKISESDIAQLLMNKQHQKAFNRAEQLYKDICLKSAYDQIDRFCSCVYIYLPYISKELILPVEIKEAVSSLIFAASRCGELYSLHLLRNLFRERYQNEFAENSIKLLPGNSVNDELRKNLCRTSAPAATKATLIDKTAADHDVSDPQYKSAYQNSENVIENEASDMKVQWSWKEDDEGQVQLPVYCSSSDTESQLTDSSDSDIDSDAYSIATSDFDTNPDMKIQWPPDKNEGQVQVSDSTKMPRMSSSYWSSSDAESVLTDSSDSDVGTSLNWNDVATYKIKHISDCDSDTKFTLSSYFDTNSDMKIQWPQDENDEGQVQVSYSAKMPRTSSWSSSDTESLLTDSSDSDISISLNWSDFAIYKL